MTEESGTTHTEAHRCGSMLSKSGSTIAKTLSTNEVIDCQEVLQEGQAIRVQRASNETANVVSGKNFNANVTFTYTVPPHYKNKKKVESNHVFS